MCSLRKSATGASAKACRSSITQQGTRKTRHTSGSRSHLAASFFRAGAVWIGRFSSRHRTRQFLASIIAVLKAAIRPAHLVIDLLFDAADALLELDDPAAEAAPDFGQASTEDQQSQHQQDDPLASTGESPRQRVKDGTGEFNRGYQHGNES